MESRKYHGWFGDGDTVKDVADAISEHGKPKKLFLQENNGFMAALVYPDKVIVVGYDGNEYCHEFILSVKAEP